MTTIALQFILKQWKWVLIILLLIVAYLFYLNNKSLKKEVTRQTTNVEVLNSKLETYRITVNTHVKKINGKDSLISLNVGKIQALTYTVNQYKDFEATNNQTITELKIKLKTAENSSNIETNTITNTVSILKDSCFSQKTEWQDISGCILKGKISIQTVNRDSLFAVINTVSKHNFWFVHWGEKVSSLTAVSKNPNTTIAGLKFVILKH